MKRGVSISEIMIDAEREGGAILSNGNDSEEVEGARERLEGAREAFEGDRDGVAEGACEGASDLAEDLEDTEDEREGEWRVDSIVLTPPSPFRIIVSLSHPPTRIAYFSCSLDPVVTARTILLFCIDNYFSRLRGSLPVFPLVA